MRRTFLLVLCAAFAGWGAAAAAETMAIRAAPHPGFGRIVFDGPHAAQHKATLDGRTLVIRFDRPVEAPLARIAAALPGYVAGATLADGGRTVRIALKGNYRLHSFEDHTASVFDLRAVADEHRLVLRVSRSEKGRTNAGPTPARRPLAHGEAEMGHPAGAPNMAVRTGEHDGFGRLVFDWRAPVGVKIEDGHGTATIRFDRPATIDLLTLRAHLPPPVTDVTEAPGKDLSLALAVPDGARLRHFTSGTSVVLDVFAPANKPVAKRAPPVPAKPLVVARPAEPAPGKPSPAADPSPVAFAPPTSLFPKLPSPRVERRIIAREAHGPDGAGLVSVDVLRAHGMATFRFNWRRDVAAAVFRRRGSVWVTFDAPARIDVAGLAVQGKPLVGAAAQAPVVGGTAVRLAIDPVYGLRVHKEGTVWVVEAVTGPTGDAKGIAVLPQGSVVAGDARIVLPVADPGKVLELTDPDVGDKIDVVSLATPGRGVFALHRFVDATVLQSAQGIAVHPLADGVKVTVQPTGVTIARAGGLRLSSVTDRLRAERAPPPPVERLFDFSAWARGPGKTPAETREILTRQAAEAPAAKRAAARLKLARWFVARGFGPEALGVLAQVARETPERSTRPGFLALRGAAHFLAGEYGPAAADLGIPVLADNVEAAPWRGAVAAMGGDWRTAAREFGDLESVIAAYPPWLAARFGLLAAESSLAIGDTGTAQSRLDRLADRGLTGGEVDMLAVLQGYYAKDTGDVDGALKLWRQVAAHGDRRASARARYAIANTLYAKKEITLDQTIDRLERLRFAWRGDVYEFDLLRRLAALYAKRDDSRDALETLKEAATYFHNVAGVQEVAKDMAGMFRHLFAGGGADKQPPVTALALYDEFRELTPAGPEGDAMIHKLAERLASVDLLGEAASLLERQVKFRLKGVEKAQVGARLAQVRLRDDKPKEALAALEESAQPNLPPDVTAARRLARAHALAKLGRRTDALAILAGDASLDAERLRAEMAWDAKDWPGAAAAFGTLVARTDDPPAPEARARLVLSRAVALALAGDTEGLAALRTADGDAMAKTKFAAAFAAVVGPVTPASLQAAIKVASDIGSVEMMLDQTRADFGGAPPAPAKTAIN